MLKAWLFAVSLFAAAAQAAPQQIHLEYDLYRNGIKLGQVSDHFTRTGDSYTLVSETRASGPLAMLWPGSIRLESSGAVTREGLHPEQFQHARSDAPHKLATARLDWKQREIEYHYKGRTWQVSGLRDGAQDQVSQLYQFMFAPSLPADYSLQVVSGRDLNEYRYAMSDGGSIQTPIGTLATRQYQRVGQRPDQKAITVWVAPARSNVPVKVRIVDEGVTLEQRLVSASIKE
jgi:hypothetical protein